MGAIMAGPMDLGGSMGMGRTGLAGLMGLGGMDRLLRLRPIMGGAGEDLRRRSERTNETRARDARPLPAFLRGCSQSIKAGSRHGPW